MSAWTAPATGLPPSTQLQGAAVIPRRGPSCLQSDAAGHAPRGARRLAADRVGTVFGDPLEWQRETRQDRSPPHDRRRLGGGPLGKAKLAARAESD
jgi:hypothetical protein